MFEEKYLTDNETKRKMSESHKGKSIWNKGRISPRKGVTLSEETKRKMSEARKLYWVRRKASFKE